MTSPLSSMMNIVLKNLSLYSGSLSLSCPMIYVPFSFARTPKKSVSGPGISAAIIFAYSA